MKRIGLGAAPPRLKNVKVTERKGSGIGLSVPSLAPLAVATARPEEAPVKVKAKKPAVSFADGGGGAGAAEGGAEAVPKLVIAEESGEDSAPPLAQAASDDTDVVVEKRRQYRARQAAGLPADAPMITKQEFLEGGIYERIQGEIQGKDPVEVRAPVYRPISSATFPTFMVQTFAQYSPTLMRVLAEGAEAVRTKAPPDPDACKKRDPNKVETFYYQKLVRDYLQGGTPYRGLLVYHGLGTGKTCSSIAAAEALYWGGLKKIYVLTPATLSKNYQRELAKCGYFPLRTQNHWSFLPVGEGDAVPYRWLRDVLGLPRAIIKKQGGGWIPDPTQPSNWDSLSATVQQTIRTQQDAHMKHRFEIIHYNGITPERLAAFAEFGVINADDSDAPAPSAGAKGHRMFDNSVVVIDEVHNLVRTINSVQIGGRTLGQVLEEHKDPKQDIEPREFTWTTPLRRERPGFRYPRAYSFYRLLTNAVGCKIVALSATPMINYAQELAVLMNLVAGEQRMVEISLKTMARDPATLGRLTEWAKQHPAIDFYAVEEGEGKATVLNVTPVPHGFQKVVDATSGYESRGFVHLPEERVPPVAESNERNMDRWAVSLLKELEAAGILPAGSADAANAEVEAVRAAGAASVRATAGFRLFTMPLLPEDPRTFVPNFVNRATLEIENKDVLKARCSGLVSYYKGQSEELMPRVGSHNVINVPMSDYMYAQYVKGRLKELEASSPPEEAEAGEGGRKEARKKGMTGAEADLYALATKTQQTGFLTLSRAACNWVFPADVPRPDMSVKDQARLLGLEQDKIIAADLATDEGPVGGAARGGAGAGGGGAGAEGAEGEEAVVGEEGDEAPVVEAPLEAGLQAIIGTLMSGLEKNAEEYLNKNLATYSPKYAMMIENIRVSKGPALVYSQFKTLEGLGIFAAALRASPEAYVPLDLVKVAGGWEIPKAIMDAGDRPRYILYTGDQDLDKRRLLLQIYNADVANLPPTLSAQVATLLGGEPDNRNGKIARVFMITQSGAEGISLFNTRQVHIMEPYWNNVRLEQVIGRAIRLCSHMNLPWDDRVVDIFTYLSVFSEKQQAEIPMPIAMADKGRTTDQIIFDIAMNKQKLADGLFEIIQSAAVDCELHFYEHGEAIKCFKFQEGARPLFMFHPDWMKDVPAALAGRR